MLAEIFPDFPYRLMVFLHIFAAVVAFAPGFVWMVAEPACGGPGESMPLAVKAQIPAMSMTVFGPALIANGVFGAAAVAMSPDRPGRVLHALGVVRASCSGSSSSALVFLGIIPMERKAAAAEDTPGPTSRIKMFGGMLHLLFTVMLIVMIWQPGG